MSADFSNIHFEGARIVRVIEDVDRHRLAFELSYPMPPGGSDFPRRRLIFHLCKRYLFDETGSGEPVIQRVEIVKLDQYHVTVRMHTSHGFREVSCRQVFQEDLTS